MTTLTLIGKPDCHLCDVAQEVIEHMLAELPDEVVAGIRTEQRSILDDPALHDLWWEKIPVVLIDGQLHGHWRVAPDRLRTALLDATGVRA
ncbi:MAG: glutaredoxin family protein [Microbacterium sp.]|uniref:glutaredoxin family protein n=1 Tax=Microbacterium sp. TaxID=51671 RepID=UPI003A8910CD